MKSRFTSWTLSSFENRLIKHRIASFVVGLLFVTFLQGVSLESASVANADACTNTSYVSDGKTYMRVDNTSGCTWTVPAGVTELVVVVVGGGGGGGGGAAGGALGAGGGGAGGLVKAETITVASGNVLSLKVGVGGTGGLKSTAGDSGTASYIKLDGVDKISSSGGRGGGRSMLAGDCLNSSGDGGDNDSFTAIAQADCSPEDTLTWPSTYARNHSDWDAAGGGSGAGGYGQNGVDIAGTGGSGGAGGIGSTNSTLTRLTSKINALALNAGAPTNYGQLDSGKYYFGGGGGGGGTPKSSSNPTANVAGYNTAGGIGGTGGIGGGGNGGFTAAAAGPTTALANSGGGGGGGGGWSNRGYEALKVGGAGADGLILIEYKVALAQISYLANGGSGTPPTETDTVIGSTISVLSGAPLSKLGSTFKGWLNKSVNYIPGDSFTVVAQIETFTAQWLVDTHTVTFDANLGTGGANISVDYGSNAISVAPVVSRSKYTFQGWAETTTASSISTWTVVGAKTLYALWSPTIYTITYSPESGTVTTSSETFTVLSKPVNWQTPTRSNYVFDGWYTDTSYSTLRGLGGAAFTSNDTETVYAKWTQESISGIPVADRTFVDALNSTGGSTKTLTIESGSTGASIRVPSGSLPNGTIVSVYSLGNSDYAKSKIDATKDYVVNLIVAWVASDGTVPVASPALTMTITNPAIKSGAIVYGLLGNTYTQLGTATADGSVAFSITTDPVITIANPVVTPPAPPAPGGGGGGGGGSVSVTTTTVVDDSAAIKAAQEKAEAEAKAKAELDLKAAQEKAAAELQAARDKADAEIKAAQLASDAVALLKAEEEAKLAAERKAAEDATLAASIATTKIVPDVSLFSVSASLKLSTYDTAYLKKYVKSLKPKATVTCIGYIYTAKTKVSVATTRAKKQATAVCSIIKKMKPTLITKVVLFSSKKAPKAAVGAKWVAVSYRVDGYKS